MIACMSDDAATILVVDDEPYLVLLVSRILRGDGFRVLVAHSAQEALVICRENPGSIDLTLLDVIMPDQSGIDLQACLANEFPEIRVIFMSGYPYEDLERRQIQIEGHNFIQKPFTPLTLTKRIWEVLGRVSGD